MVVHVVAVGRVRDAALRAACEDYLRRARRGLKIRVAEVPDAGRRAPTPAAARRLEAMRLDAAVPPGAYTVALTRTGRPLSSDAFARLLGQWREGARDVAVLLGGAFGLDDRLLAAADLQLSLSPLTLPHDLARLLVLEQIYRAGTILRGEPYHKGRG
ncbi:MAG: 23S rRNA (pseudouridine(1915)-N(3))-methyltransferase RlmH [Gemmatimonadota bacterium]|nr:23S rRNA (pseudouridine(1915)-N(3))-methyltransferase RlmH [Gemmatimonadota bacterium]